MTLFDDNLMSLVSRAEYRDNGVTLRVIMERDIKVIDVKGRMN